MVLISPWETETDDGFVKEVTKSHMDTKTLFLDLDMFFPFQFQLIQQTHDTLPAKCCMAYTGSFTHLTEKYSTAKSVKSIVKRGL